MAITINHVRTISDAELLELSRRNPGYQFERRCDGGLIVTPTGGKSGYRSGEVFRQLAEWSRTTDVGIAFDSSTGFRLEDGSVLAPDAAWVSRERWQALRSEEQETFPPLCPNVVFEVRSKSDGVEDLRTKMREYADNGAQLAVLIDPYDRFVELWRADGKATRIEQPDQIAFDRPLRGFTLEMARLYE